MTVAATRRRPGRPRARYSYGPEAIAWIEENCLLPTGEHAGEPFRLLPWQRDWITDLFETDARGKARYRWALLGVPKGNGKTPLLSALALYHLLGDQDVIDPWAVVSAAADKQADIAFEACRRMCEMSPALADRTHRYRWEIKRKDNGGKIERVAASGGKLDGKIISLLLVDELHEWTQENWVVLTGGALKRPTSRILQATTAGWDRDSICYREYAKGRAIQAGEVANPTYLFRWHEAPPEADWRAPETWAACNPSYGALIHEHTLADLAQNIPESQFRRYRLNQWVAAETFWLPAGAWAACAEAAVALDHDSPIWVGWDASTRRDSTAVVAVQRQGTRVVVVPRIWSRPRNPDGSFVEDWLVPIAEVEEYVSGLFEAYDCRGVAYDPAFITWSADTLSARGLAMVDWPQTDGRMVPATQALYELVVNEELAHDGDPTMASHVASVVAKATRSGGQRLGKGQQARQIDLAIALVMAVGLMAGDVVEAPAWGFY